ncbi:hypothetical protein ACOSP6_05625 [Tenacibaculum sp. MEBiC06402]
MKAKPIFIRLIKAYGNEYVIKFPKLIITVDRYYYTKMSNSPDEYKFI